MFEHKEALAIALGLLLFFCTFPLFAADEGFTLSGGGGTLWVEEDGASAYWQAGLSYRGKMPLSVGLHGGGLYSSLPWADVDGWGLLLSGRADTQPVGLRLIGAYVNHSLLEINSGKTGIRNEGGEAGFLGLALPLGIGDFIIEPSYFYGSASWEDGELYWFFGKPDIPILHAPGVSVSYNKRHSVNFYYLSMQADIINNKDEPLFNSQLDCVTGFYRFSLEGEKPIFTGTLGWLYGAGSLEGALTSANQSYSFFPYRIYTVDADMDVHLAYLILDTRLSRGLFDVHFTLGAVHGFAGEAGAGIHYKKKKSLFYDGSEDWEELSLSIEGIGAAFLLLDVGIPSLRLGHGKYLALNVNKLFAIPWGYEGLLENTGESVNRGNSGPLIRSMLLSGWSLNIGLRF
jgi:hypothetical protein